MCSLQSPTVEVTPYYLKKAERPKSQQGFNIFDEHKRILDDKFKNKSSSLVRYLMDCYFSNHTATPEGFLIWISNGEKL